MSEGKAEMTPPEREDPYGGEDEMDPPETVMGHQMPEMDIGESELIRQSKMNFSGEIARVFEESVIPKQIPGYKEMRYRLLHMANYFLASSGKTSFADLGTSNGRMIRDIVAALAAQEDPRLTETTFLGLDFEQDMIDQAEILIGEMRENPHLKEVVDRYRMRNVLSGNEDVPRIGLFKHDLRHGLPDAVRNCSVITSVLTIQFVPVEHRPKILRQVYDALSPGGAFLFVEKVLHPNAEMNDVLDTLYYQDKARNGVKHEDIVNKRRSLEGHLVPYTREGNIQLLEAAGFKNHNIAEFWRSLQFTGFLAVK